MICISTDSGPNNRARLRWTTIAAAAVAVACWASGARAQLVSPGPGKQWNATFADEFNAGSSDLSPWSYETGNNNGWGNGEVENYTTNSSNVSVSGGALHIDAIGTTSNGNTTYTSGRIRTSTSFSQAYGLFEFRAKLPAGQGLWPALWMMPQGSVYGGWPNSGEIDVMESTGQNTGWVSGSLHSGTDSGHQDTQTGKYQPAGFDTTAFHTYDLQWSPGPDSSHPATLRWYVDGTLYETQTGGWVVPSGASDADAPFDQPFYLIMNLAVGGDFVGGLTPGAGTYDMQVDYVRAYQLGAQGVPEPASAGTLTAVAALGAARRRRQEKRHISQAKVEI